MIFFSVELKNLHFEYYTVNMITSNNDYSINEDQNGDRNLSKKGLKLKLIKLNLHIIIIIITYYLIPIF